MNLIVWICVLLCVCAGLGNAQKKGFSFGYKDSSCHDLKALHNISWWYDWGSQPFYVYNHEQHCGNMDAISHTHVPMIWGYYPSSLAKVSIPTDAEALLGFNEPNHKEQSNITPEKAAAHWHEIEAVSHGVPLVSPSATGCGNPATCIGDTNDWFDKFFHACTHCRIDYLAAHIYSCDPHHVMSFLRALYNRYHKKIWLTEFACPRTHDPHKQLNFMKAVLPMLENADFIYRYVWFVGRAIGGTWVTESANLFQTNSSHLTALGRYYNDFHSAPHGAIVG